MRFAEVLNPDGTIYTDNLRTAKVTDHFILNGLGWGGMPLHVVVGAAEQEPGHIAYSERDFLGGIALSSYRFG